MSLFRISDPRVPPANAHVTRGEVREACGPPPAALTSTVKSQVWAAACYSSLLASPSHTLEEPPPLHEEV